MRLTRAHVVAAGAAIAAAPTAGRAQTLTTVRVINPPLEGAAQSIYAKEMGFFAKAGSTRRSS